MTVSLRNMNFSYISILCKQRIRVIELPASRHKRAADG
jgi:hypothetical protein